MISPVIKFGKLTDSEAMNFIKENMNSVVSATGKYKLEIKISTIYEAEKYIDSFIGKKVRSPALHANININCITKNHLFSRTPEDVIRRVNLFSDAIEVLEISSRVHAVDTSEEKFTYYEILGKSRYGKIINVKVSEKQGGGKILWTIIDIK